MSSVMSTIRSAFSVLTRKVVIMSDKRATIPVGFMQVYADKRINKIAAIHRAKVLQSLVTFFATSTSSAMAIAELIEWEIVYNIGLASTMIMLPLWTTALMFHNQIGFLYYNNKTDQVRISYVNTWGHRTDEIVYLDNVKPKSETANTLSERFYSRFELYNKKGHKRITLAPHYILNKTLFKKIYDS